MRQATPASLPAVLKRFETPDEVHEFTNGRYEVVRLVGTTIGRVIYQPGWRWSVDVGATLGQSSCAIEHVVVVISGRLAAVFDDGSTIELGAGDISYVPPGHDSWVIGDEPYVSLHFLGSE